MILDNCIFDKMVPVGLLGLQTNTQPFIGILEINESKFLDKFIVLKNVILQSASFVAASYSLNVGTGIKIRFFDKKALQKL